MSAIDYKLLNSNGISLKVFYNSSTNLSKYTNQRIFVRNLNTSFSWKNHRLVAFIAKSGKNAIRALKLGLNLTLKDFLCCVYYCDWQGLCKESKIVGANFYKFA